MNSGAEGIGGMGEKGIGDERITHENLLRRFFICAVLELLILNKNVLRLKEEENAGLVRVCVCVNPSFLDQVSWEECEWYEAVSHFIMNCDNCSLWNNLLKNVSYNSSRHLQIL